MGSNHRRLSRRFYRERPPLKQTRPDVLKRLISRQSSVFSTTTQPRSWNNGPGVSGQCLPGPVRREAGEEIAKDCLLMHRDSEAGHSGGQRRVPRGGDRGSGEVQGGLA